MARSTLAAETLAMVDSIDSAIFSASLFTELMTGLIQTETLHTTLVTDCKSLHDNLGSGKAVIEKRLRIEMAAIKEALERKIVNEVILEEEEDEELVLELEASEDVKQANEEKDPEKNDQGKEDQGQDNQDKNDQGNEDQGNEVQGNEIQGNDDQGNDDQGKDDQDKDDQDKDDQDKDDQGKDDQGRIEEPEESVDEIFASSPQPRAPAVRKSRKNNVKGAPQIPDSEPTKSVDTRVEKETDEKTAAVVETIEVNKTPLKDKSVEVTPTKTVNISRNLILKTPPSVCCRKVNTVNVAAIENLQQPKSIEGRRKSSNASDPDDEVAGKENDDKDYWYKLKYRQPFSRGEEEALVSYFQQRGGYSLKGGNKIWQKIEEEWICPGRTWSSLKERWERHIEKNLKKFGTSKTMLMEKDKENPSSSKCSGAGGKSYSRDEDLKIIEFISENKRFDDVKGNELWKIMVDRNVVEGRTWQSLKERFRKVIMKKIRQYGLPKDVVAQFAKEGKGGKEKRIQ